MKEIEEQYVKLFNTGIYHIMLNAYCLIGDYTNAKKCVRKLRDLGEREGLLTLKLANIYNSQCKHVEAKELCERAINIMKETGDRKGEAGAYGQCGTTFICLGEYVKAKEYLEKALAIRREIGYIKGEAADYKNLGTVFICLGEYAKAQEYTKKALAIDLKIGDKDEEAENCVNLAAVLLPVGEHTKAREYIEKALAIRMKIGDRKGEAGDYEKLGNVFKGIGQYAKAQEYIDKALAIRMEIGDKKGQAFNYGNLGTVFSSLGKYARAQEYHEKALAIRLQIGDRKRQAEDYGNLGTVFLALGECAKAKEYIEKALAIKVEVGDRKGEASEYGQLGSLFTFLGKYAKAQEYIEKALAITIEIGDRRGEASDYGKLGAVFRSLAEYEKAKKYLFKALAIRMELGDRNGEAADYGNLGKVFQCVGEYAKAQEYHEKALAITMEIGDRDGEAAEYATLGAVFVSLGEYAKAQEYYEKALAITIETGDRKGQAAEYGNLGSVLLYLDEYAKAKEYTEKAIAFAVEIGDRGGEAKGYSNLGAAFQYLGDYAKAEEYIEKALAIAIEIGDRNGQAIHYRNLGTMFLSLGEYLKAKECLEKALPICKDIGDGDSECECHLRLFYVELCQGKVQEAFYYLLESVRKREELRVFLEDNDQFKISFSDRHLISNQMMSELLCAFRKPYDALCVEEMGRARALADLMAAQYSLENKQISDFPYSRIENIMKKERNSSCLYITYHQQDVLVWVLKASGVIHFRRTEVHKEIVDARLVPSLDDFFAKSFRSFGVLAEENCEDRSLNDIEPKLESSQEESNTALRLDKDDGKESQDLESNLSLCYRMVIAPVVDLLDEPEIIVVPDRFLNQVPFAALRDESGKYLSEAYRIRIVPSLSILKLIQDSPADYHSQTGALIVGDPTVGDVFYNGLGPLECARKEAEMVGRLLGVPPLLGECATKRAVLEVINSVSLIHIAAHGNAERGEIALAPTVRIAGGAPQDDDYLLTMSDISKARLRAKLVVLSCCHSARGQIRAEGVVGIARAFLGSGARSVLVALWALEDRATEQLMNHFYEHLAHGESASESLHEAMKWMRDNGFPKVEDWAPFVLIGDNVTFDFGKERRETDGGELEEELEPHKK
ncbi:uncharacterized protein LOC144660435 [Oculina patagonica]